MERLFDIHKHWRPDVDWVTFDDLVFTDHHDESTQIAMLFFENNYGVSVLFGEHAYSNGVDTYEVAILRGNASSFEIANDTFITNDVLGHLNSDEVDDVIQAAQYRLE